ncbi:aldehyde dehydrogenase family protein [Saprospiraceae bacterium]|jgi:aldehyde dehydrogenase (NAD+)|nr:aldehyde dehydrogenase family protein [bacterium]MDC3210819.1 aldehyde dehydrogenase family protein [Saprospiraceae bacterium]MDC3219886.1 aldehyde dehydrogenase family protein [Saprospiraceae bacterium]MDG1434238.1 aldehyde dehydrogenase family protein [Saprospiraceae bacterium]
MSATLTFPVETNVSDINRIFELQKKNQFDIANSSASQRYAKLEKLHKAVLKYRNEIKDALYNDFRKHPSEVDLTEIYPVTSELKHTKSHLNKWMRKHKVSTPISMLGSSSYIKYEPKGVVLIIAPWNFPLNLTFGPLVSAIAAGNTVMVKPSENTPHISALMKKIIEEIYEENEVAVLEGGVATSQALLALPFNHTFFTGAPHIGKIVMEAASKHLTSVTLELGGKSPTIVDETANIDMAARRVAWGKFINNGQICIAPDYLFVHESKKEAFITAVKEHLKIFFTENALNEKSYNRIVNNRHFERVKSYVDDAMVKGAKIEIGGDFDGDQDYISPTIMTNVSKNSSLMTEEIFGPVLPVYGFTDLQEVIDEINSKEKPLALYIYSSSRKNQNRIIENTRAGGTCINHNAVHFFNANLPFGGSNNSGIGKSHGWYGFEAFSNARGVLKQHIPNALDLLMPPYNNFKQRLIDLTIKYF